VATVTSGSLGHRLEPAQGAEELLRERLAHQPACERPGPAGTGSVEPLTGMLDLLWKGQTSRHGGRTAQRPEIFEEAQMAVHLAVTLVHWFTTGAIQRIP